MTPEQWVTIIGQLGFPVALAIYLLWRDKGRDKDVTEREKASIAREERLGSRIDQLEDEHRKELVQLTQNCTEAIQQNRYHTKHLSSCIDSLIEYLKHMPPAAPPPTQENQGYRPHPSHQNIVRPRNVDDTTEVRSRRRG